MKYDKNEDLVISFRFPGSKMKDAGKGALV